MRGYGQTWSKTGELLSLLRKHKAFLQFLSSFFPDFGEEFSVRCLFAVARSAQVTGVVRVGPIAICPLLRGDNTAVRSPIRPG